MFDPGKSGPQQLDGAAGLAPIQTEARDDTPATRLRGRTLVAARIAWVAVAALTLALFVVGTVVAAQRLSVVCHAPRCAAGQFADTDVPALRDLHLSVQFYAGYAVGLQALFALTYAVVAAIIFWRRSDDWLALFISLTLLLFGAATFSPGSLTSMVDYARRALPAWWMPATGLIFLGSVSFIAFLLIFPDGRFRPAWMAWLALAWVAFQFPRYFFPGSFLSQDTWPAIIQAVIWVAFLGMLVVAQTYRYRHISTPAQRQQTKWVVFGVAAALIGFVGGSVALTVFLSGAATPSALLVDFIGNAFLYLCLLLIPLTIAIAMLRHHLFDIDLIISQTFVYASLTAILALVYQAALVALQTLFLTLTGQASFVANVLSTVLIGALFEPLRRRLKLVAGRFIPHPETQVTTT